MPLRTDQDWQAVLDLCRRYGVNADIFARIERRAGLRRKGDHTDEEFGAKKAELLARL